jgi:hypothetical protein
MPDPPAPSNRLAAIQRRGRRTRIRLAGAAAVCAALVVSLPAALGGGTVARSHFDGCPAVPSDFAPDQLPPTSVPGPLAPPGAVQAILCDYDLVQEGNLIYPSPTTRLVLTRGVDQLVTRLNNLTADPGIDPCFAIGGGGYINLVYPDGGTITIEFSGQCLTVRRGDIFRYDREGVLQAFKDQYQQQGR